MKVVEFVKILVTTVILVRLLTVGLKATNVLIQTLPLAHQDYSNWWLILVLNATQHVLLACIPTQIPEDVSIALTVALNVLVMISVLFVNHFLGMATVCIITNAFKRTNLKKIINIFKLIYLINIFSCPDSLLMLPNDPNDPN